MRDCVLCVLGHVATTQLRLMVMSQGHVVVWEPSPERVAESVVSRLAREIAKNPPLKPMEDVKPGAEKPYWRRFERKRRPR